ncbi:MAG: DUF1127 domain-containing protein [Rhodospirillales bacterium]
MTIQNDNVLEVPNLSRRAGRVLDPISRAALGRHARQVEMLRFLHKATKFLSQSIKAVFGWLDRWNERVILDRELRSLPDYLLRDIGIQRHQISAVVNNKLRREDLVLSPIGSQVRPSAVKAAEAVNEDKDSEKPLAA